MEHVVDLDAPIEKVWSMLSDVTQLGSFRGWGPIPGIVEASWEAGAGEQGSIRRVKNADGTTHREEVMACVRPSKLEDRIYDLTSPLRFMVNDVRDHFDLEPLGAGTRLRRTFVFELRSPVLWPLAALIRGAMFRAVVRHHAEMGRRLA